MRSIYRVQRERAEAGEFCESRRLEAQLGIAVKRERPRQVPPTTPLLTKLEVNHRRVESMFKELMNFKYKRTGVQALGFYIVFLLIGALLGGVVSGLLQTGSNADFQTQYNIGIKIGSYVAIIYCTILSLIMLIAKKLYKSAQAIVLFLLTILGAMVMACLLGCVFPAILSTFEAKD